MEIFDDAYRHARRRGLKRVVLTGAESTGKTTLARALADHYDTLWAPEYLRHFVDEKGALPTFDDIDAIARGHLEQEAALLPDARRVLFLDMDLIATCLGSRYYFGTCPAWIEQAADTYRADLYLLADDDIPWVADPGQRDGEHVRDAFQPLYRAMLRERNLPHVTLRGSPEERLATATEAVDALLAESP